VTASENTTYTRQIHLGHKHDIFLKLYCNLANRIARHSIAVQTGPEAYLACCKMSTGRGVAVTIHVHLAPKLKKELSYNSAPPLWLRSLLYGEI